MPTKAERHEAIRERARRAIRDLYHNATPRYPSLDDPEAERFQAWFEFAAECEIDYLDGGAYGKDYRATLLHPANAGKLKSPRARDYYVRHGLRDMHEDQARNAWERISEYGAVYQYGRGGRTLAPAELYSDRGFSSGPKVDYADLSCIADTVDLIRVVESFNAVVRAWCHDVPAMWAEQAQADLDESAEKHERSNT